MTYTARLVVLAALPCLSLVACGTSRTTGIAEDDVLAQIEYRMTLDDLRRLLGAALEHQASVVCVDSHPLTITSLCIPSAEATFYFVFSQDALVRIVESPEYDFTMETYLGSPARRDLPPETDSRVQKVLNAPRLTPGEMRQMTLDYIAATEEASKKMDYGMLAPLVPLLILELAISGLPPGECDKGRTIGFTLPLGLTEAEVASRLGKPVYTRTEGRLTIHLYTLDRGSNENASCWVRIDFDSGASIAVFSNEFLNWEWIAEAATGKKIPG